MTGNMLAGTPDLIDRVNAKCGELKKTKKDIADMSGINRSTVSQYLNRKLENQQSDQISKLEEWLEGWLGEVGEPQTLSTAGEGGQEAPAVPFHKRENFETADFNSVTGLCALCQETLDIGIVVGKSGYGKTYTLKNYAQLPRVVHIECNETMNCKDIVRRIEQAVGLPKISGSIDERMGRLCTFFNTNKGYLLIVDEADKLLSKYTIKKIELIRTLSDSAKVGIVLAGEPALEAAIKAYDERFANRIGLLYKLRGLSRKDVDRYFEGYGVDQETMEELYKRACGHNTGCFRLFDRTLNNILRILRISGKNSLTYDVLKEASGMMVL